MNWYFYWYYTIYNIYRKVSNDSQFAIFATGFFSIIILFWMYGILSMVLNFYNSIYLLYNNESIFVMIWIGVLLLNYLFLLKKRELLIRFNTYLNVRSSKKDVFFILLSILSIVWLIYGIIIARTNLL
jgi:hypothetical protein